MSDDKPSLLWHSNAPWSPTGYGSQTALFLPKLAEHFNLGISSFYGLEANVIHWGSTPVYPGLGASYGNETIAAHAEAHHGEMRDGLTATLMDVWPLDAAIWRNLNVCSWVPVDHEPAPRPVTEFFFGSGAVPIAMSKFGERMLTEAGLDPLYCPHAVDTAIYHPYDKAEARKETHIPADAYIVGMVAANKGNPSRKCFAEALLAFKQFHAKHSEARLYLHTEITGMFEGINLPEMIRDCGVDLKLVIFPDQYRTIFFPFKPETMAKVYSSFDVLLACSAGEGFGIPVVEAQACGVPVIVSDFSAQPELCGAGWLVEGTKTYTKIRSWQFRPDVDDMADALRRAYSRSPAAVAENAIKARDFSKQYDLDHVFTTRMLPTLEQVQERFDARKPMKLEAVA